MVDLRGVVCSGGVGLECDDGLESDVGLEECEVGLEYGVFLSRLLSTLCIILSFHLLDFCRAVRSLSSSFSASSSFFLIRDLSVSEVSSFSSISLNLSSSLWSSSWRSGRIFL